MGENQRFHLGATREDLLRQPRVADFAEAEVLAPMEDGAPVGRDQRSVQKAIPSYAKLGMDAVIASRSASEAV